MLFKFASLVGHAQPHFYASVQLYYFLRSCTLHITVINTFLPQLLTCLKRNIYIHFFFWGGGGGGMINFPHQNITQEIGLSFSGQLDMMINK